MEYYETGSLTQSQADEFVTWFSNEIGTDYEENEADEDGKVYLMFCDLTPSEVKKIRAYENTSINGKG